MRVVVSLSDLNPAERVGLPGKTLGDYWRQFGGPVGMLDDPYGNWRPVSLAAFDFERDSRKFVVITYWEYKADAVLPDIAPGEVIVDEYLLAEDPS